MRVWIVSFVVLFTMAEFYQWLKHFTLPLPIYILGGAFLAIASNYDRFAGFSLERTDETTSQSLPQSANLLSQSRQFLKLKRPPAFTITQIQNPKS